MNVSEFYAQLCESLINEETCYCWIPDAKGALLKAAEEIRNTAPPQREWVSLTDEEILSEIPLTTSRPITEFARAIEAKLKERNT